VKICLVEDDGFKRDKLRQRLGELFATADIREAKSAKSAFQLIRQGLPSLIVLDMSLPTFDIAADESGGRPQGFGGVEVLREMDRRDIQIPVVVVTQYEVFGEERLGIRELASRLANEHPNTFKGLVYYEASSERWQKDFDAVVSNAVKSNVTR
jgi:CheY-like chemotaxis protein